MEDCFTRYSVISQCCCNVLIIVSILTLLGTFLGGLTRAANSNSIFLPNSNLNLKLKILWNSNSKIFKASSS